MMNRYKKVYRKNVDKHTQYTVIRTSNTHKQIRKGRKEKKNNNTDKYSSEQKKKDISVKETHTQRKKVKETQRN